MKKRFFRPELILWMVAGLVTLPFHPAHAYIDGGTGSYVIQIIIGLVVGVGYTLRAFGGAIRNKFKRQKNVNDR